MITNYSFESVLETTRRNLAYLIHSGNLSVSALADIVGVSKAYISRWISGGENGSVPSLKLICEVCRAFEISMDQLCLTDLSNPNERCVESIVPKNTDEALALSMFSSLCTYDQDTVLRVLQSMLSNSSHATVEFDASVLESKD